MDTVTQFIVETETHRPMLLALLKVFAANGIAESLTCKLLQAFQHIRCRYPHPFYYGGYSNAPKLALRSSNIQYRRGYARQNNRIKTFLLEYNVEPFSNLATDLAARTIESIMKNLKLSQDGKRPCPVKF